MRAALFTNGSETISDSAELTLGWSFFFLPAITGRGQEEVTSQDTHTPVCFYLCENFYTRNITTQTTGQIKSAVVNKDPSSVKSLFQTCGFRGESGLTRVSVN